MPVEPAPAPPSRPAAATEAGVAEALLAAATGSAEPLTVTALREALDRPLRRPEERLAQIAEELVGAGRLYRFAPFRGKKPRYWHADHRAYARQTIEAALGDKPRSLTDLEKSLAGRLGDLSKLQRQEVLQQLVGERRVYELPKLPGSRSARYSVQPPDPCEYLRTPINRLRKQVEKLAGELAAYGVPGPRTWAAAVELLGGPAADTAARVSPPESTAPQPSAPMVAQPPVDPRQPAESAAAQAEPRPAAAFAEEFDAAFARLDRQKGAHNFVSLVDLRTALPGFAREEFDGKLRELRRAGRYELSAAESVDGLRLEQREAGVEEAGLLLLYASRKSP